MLTDDAGLAGQDTPGDLNAADIRGESMAPLCSLVEAVKAMTCPLPAAFSVGVFPSAASTLIFSSDFRRIAFMVTADVVIYKLGIMVLPRVLVLGNVQAFGSRNYG